MKVVARFERVGSPEVKAEIRNDGFEDYLWDCTTEKQCVTSPAFFREILVADNIYREIPPQPCDKNVSSANGNGHVRRDTISLSLTNLEGSKLEMTFKSEDDLAITCMSLGLGISSGESLNSFFAHCATLPGTEIDFAKE